MSPTVNSKNGNTVFLKQEKEILLYHVPDCFYGFARLVEGETRVGVFASRSIKVGEPLTYDYRYFKQLFSFIAFMMRTYILNLEHIFLQCIFGYKRKHLPAVC